MSRNIVVIKIGTGVLTRSEGGTLNEASLVRLVTAVSELVASGVPCVMVSSGAVGAGVSALSLDGYPSDTATRQACAAVGQTRLMHAYENLFQKFQLNVAQILLSADDLANSSRSTNVLNTLKRLLQNGAIVPIINENDSVAVEELRVGDNDMLSSRVAQILQARMLVILSTVNGLMREDGTIIDQVEDISEVLKHVRDDHGKFSIGGMRSKLTAVERAIAAGVETVIANGHQSDNLRAIINGEAHGSRFIAS
ncbi:MAG TPA: glutamate 5-kinase [Verrucomicrobiales bacterium]|nr:glutamate 5-kinase [Verrucomicrobiales bacterium]HCI92435.1 glutamate 5-kinase [Verrucomicrobiales bacterium]HCL96888.1 glutamate 5-kinase [Verrucomicrobiales bacterium]